MFVPVSCISVGFWSVGYLRSMSSALRRELVLTMSLDIDLGRMIVLYKLTITISVKISPEYPIQTNALGLGLRSQQ